MNGLVPKQLQDGSATLLGHYTPTQHLRLVIGLEHPNLAAEEIFLEQLHDRNSPHFMKFLTAAEWTQRFSPSAEDEQAVVHWATAQGLTVTQRYPNRLLVDVEGPAGTIEKALSVTINSYSLSGRTAFSNDRAPTLPASLLGIVHSVGGLNSIQVLSPASSNMSEPDFPDYSAGPAIALAGSAHADANAKRPVLAKGKDLITNITGGAYDPTDIYSAQMFDVNALYNVSHCCNPLNNPGSSPPDSSIAIATAGSQNFSDLAGFQASYPYLAYYATQVTVDGTPNCCDGEGTLDFEWSIAWSNSFGASQNTAHVWLYDGANALNSTFTDIYNSILSGGNARVFSTSWGCEETVCIPASLMDTDHGIFNAMAGQGWTIVASSGDQGATGGSANYCPPADAVIYPASDPNIVAAGGTETVLASGVFFAETGWTGGPNGCANNDGGSGGGVSAYYAAPSYQSNVLGNSSRFVPDLSLNSDPQTPQNYYFKGKLQAVGGTSIVAPEIAGFFAQENAYLDYWAQNRGCIERTTCAPIGNGNFYLYNIAANLMPPHYPFYDVTSGCNNNDITAEYGLGYYCAGPGYDQVTGWGTFNALQLAWAINWFVSGDVAPNAALSSNATPGTWYNSDPYVEWTITEVTGGLTYPTGVSGFSYSWDTPPPDSNSVSRPATADGFFTGPEVANSTFGLEHVSAAGQGCHIAYVRGYSNSGLNQVQSFGPVCYDSVPPVSTVVVSGTLISGTQYGSAVTVTLSATDASSGVAHTYYALDGDSVTTYGGPFVVSATGIHTLRDYSIDVAGNTEATNTTTFSIVPLSVTVSPTSVSFPATAVGSTSAAQSITLKNSGGSSLKLTSIALTSGEPADFTESNNCGSTLAAGTSCTISVSFKPGAAGAETTNVAITDNASGSPQKVVLSGTATAAAAAVTLSPTSVSFPATAVGSTSAAQSITLKNSGGSSLKLTSIALTSGEPADFTESNNCGSTLAAGASCTISVSFKPGAAGAETTNVAVTDNASGSPQKVVLSGTATAAAAAVTLSPTSVSFPATAVGSTSAAQSITLKNSGGSSLKLTSIALTSGEPADFTESNNCGSTLAAGTSCTISVSFKPGAAGAETTNVAITDNASGSPQKVVLSGTATAAAAAVTLSPTSVSFPATAVGSTSAAQSITLKNSGGSSLKLTSIALTSGEPADFTESNNCGSTLAAGTSCTISVSFKPGAAGAETTNVAITDNASGSPQKVVLSGTATAAAAAVTLSPTSVSFPATAVGSTSAAQSITLKNSGGSSLKLTSIALTSGEPADFTESNNCGSTLAAGASCTISVSFKPGAAGAETTNVAVTDNASGSPQKVVLSGTATAAAAAVTLSPTSVSFPATAVGSTSAAQSITLKNSGGSSLKLTSIALTSGEPADFTESNNCGSTLAAGTSCTISVSFKPGAAGAETTNVAITDNASGSPQKVVLSGTATAAAAAVTLSPTSVSFPATAVGSTSAAQSITLKNSGGSSLKLTSIALTSGEPADFMESNNCGSTLAAGTSCTISVSFKPGAAGAESTNVKARHETEFYAR